MQALSLFFYSFAIVIALRDVQIITIKYETAGTFIYLF